MDDDCKLFTNDTTKKNNKLKESKWLHILLYIYIVPLLKVAGAIRTYRYIKRDMYVLYFELFESTIRILYIYRKKLIKINYY